MHVHQSSLDLAGRHAIANHLSATATDRAKLVLVVQLVLQQAVCVHSSVDLDAAMQLLQPPHLLFCVLPFPISCGADSASPLTMLGRVSPGSTPDTLPQSSFNALCPFEFVS